MKCGGDEYQAMAVHIDETVVEFSVTIGAIRRIRHNIKVKVTSWFRRGQLFPWRYAVILTGLDLATIEDVLRHLLESLYARYEICFERGQGAQDKDTAGITTLPCEPNGIGIERP